MAHSICPVWIARFNIKMSWQRMVGYGSLWLWILMMFNSITLYSNATNIRESLYITQIISLVAAILGMLFLVIIVRPNDVLAKNRTILIASCVTMMLGTMLSFFVDSQTAIGMLFLGLSSILTGLGSGVLFLCWSQIFFRVGGKVALAELAVGSAVGFLASLLLSLAPTIFATICTVIFAMLATFLAYRCCLELYDTPEGKFKLTRSATTPKLSHQTIFLFSKSLIGAALIGAIQGFYDVTSGFRTYAMDDSYGVYLLVAGLGAILLMTLIAVFFSHDSIFYTYRFSILVLCIGCLTTPFLGDNQSYVTVLIFAGYSCFCVVLFAICLDISASFVINPVRSVGLGFIALYGGEFLGELAAHGMNAASMSVPDLTVITLCAVGILLIAHLFLFTETDLIKIGIGENNLLENITNIQVDSSEAAQSGESHFYASAAPFNSEVSNNEYFNASHNSTESSRPNHPSKSFETTLEDPGTSQASMTSDATAAPMTDQAAPTPPDPATIIAERYGLSPRECDVLPLLLEGRTIVRIQETLFISAGTVSTHIRHIYQKTGQANRQELIDLAQSIAENECKPEDGVQ